MNRFAPWLAAALVVAAAPPPATAQPLSASALFARSVVASHFVLQCPNQVTQSFPIGGAAQTSWRICWHEVAGLNSLDDPNGLVIGPVDFKTSPSAPWRRIVYDMRISDFFVPYHPGSPRYYDLSTFNFTLETIPASGCPASVGGTLLSPRVCKEVHDRGLLWMSGPKNGSSAMRGGEVVLWGVIYADNYKYVERYAFRDDGTIVGEEGATAQNLPYDELTTHVHNALWRLDLDLFDPVNDAMHFVHTEPITGPSATDTMPAITAAGGIKYNARRFDAIMLTNTAYQNAQKHHPAYMLMPSELHGLTQHQEPFTQNDFWVTPYDPAQMAASQLVSYVAGRPSVAHRDVVLWYKGSLHHHPRDEDGAYANGGSGPWHGTALTMFSGFMLMPFDLFDCTPFFGPCP